MSSPTEDIETIRKFIQDASESGLDGCEEAMEALTRVNTDRLEMIEDFAIFSEGIQHG